MPGLIVLVLGLASIFAPPCSAMQSGDACDKASSQAEINACSAERYQAAEREMKDAYGKVRARSRGKRGDLLTRAQNAWSRFRDAQCELESSAARGGSAFAALRNDCLTRLSTARTEDLKRLLHDM